MKLEIDAHILKNKVVITRMAEDDVCFCMSLKCASFNPSTFECGSLKLLAGQEEASCDSRANLRVMEYQINQLSLFFSAFSLSSYTCGLSSRI